jgi:hypothetical protein
MNEILSEVTDTELLDLADKARSRVSYHNAAEGASYTNEASARRAAFNYWDAVKQELTKRDLTARPGQYLL